jgi:hypothetical protein
MMSMTPTNAAEFVRRLKKVVKEAKKLTKASGMKPHAVYELYVAVRAITDIAKKYKITLVNTRKPKELRFPLAPAEKADYPYMIVSPKGKGSAAIIFQICLGTKYYNTFGTSFAPDLSIQTHTSPLAAPHAADVVFCWDCKYYADDRLPRDTIEGLSGKMLGTFKPAGKAVPTIFTAPELPNANAIVTNCSESTYKPQDLTSFGVEELSGFRPRKKGCRRP